jgi:Flp pilus assembly protein TadD
MCGTFIHRLAITAVVGFPVWLGGCFLSPQVPEERLNQAVKLVEEGSEHLRLGRLDEASAAFSVAVELAPLAAAVDGQGCVALLRGDFGQAERLFTAAYEMDGSYDEALANLALLMDVSGQKERAKQLYEQSVSAMPGHVGVRNNRAVLEYEQGQRKILVVQELEKAGLLAKHGVVSENLARMGRTGN